MHFIDMNCLCCESEKIRPRPLGLAEFFSCQKCGLIFKSKIEESNSLNNLVQYYQENDPHCPVAHSKKDFFQFAIRYLSRKLDKTQRKILDVGCGYGYFLDIASRYGWDVSGVEIAESAVKEAQKKLGTTRVLHGTLSQAGFPDKLVDAITLWDVLVMVQNPYEELKECYRILADGGQIGIRVRNVFFQKILKFGYVLQKRITRGFFISRPDVFHPFCFSRKSIYLLLQRAGFSNIQILNSPLTEGDPYGYMENNALVRVVKHSVDFISRLFFYLSGKRWVIGPSLLIFAQKPSSQT
jgi:SAM-dependent methyltransferase